MTTSKNSKTTILIIEDNHICQAIYQAYLPSSIYHLTIVDSAHTALQQVQMIQFDSIILDLGLPDLSGMEVLNRIRKSTLNQTTSVIVISSHVDATLKQQALQLGATAVFTKPVGAEDLQQMIKENLS